MRQTYETMEVRWLPSMIKLIEKRADVCAEFLRYATYLVRRGLVCNTFGNIVVRVPCAGLPNGALYTKQRGVSLEECMPEHIVVTAAHSNELIAGMEPPSNGHQMSREIMRVRSDVNAIIHTHANIVCAYFAVFADEPFLYVGNDTPLVLGAPPRILPKHINLELDATLVEESIGDANCIVMPNHGFVTMGRTLSEAYHRHTAFVAEVERMMMVRATNKASDTSFLDAAESNAMYRLADKVIYGRDVAG